MGREEGQPGAGSDAIVTSKKLCQQATAGDKVNSTAPGADGWETLLWQLSEVTSRGDAAKQYRARRIFCRRCGSSGQTEVGQTAQAPHGEADAIHCHKTLWQDVLHPLLRHLQATVVCLDDYFQDFKGTSWPVHDLCAGPACSQQPTQVEPS